VFYKETTVIALSPECVVFYKEIAVIALSPECVVFYKEIASFFLVKYHTFRRPSNDNYFFVNTTHSGD
jgi:hypothetical protein